LKFEISSPIYGLWIYDWLHCCSPWCNISKLWWLFFQSAVSVAVFMLERQIDLLPFSYYRRSKCVAVFMPECDQGILPRNSVSWWYIPTFQSCGLALTRWTMYLHYKTHFSPRPHMIHLSKHYSVVIRLDFFVYDFILRNYSILDFHKNPDNSHC